MENYIVSARKYRPATFDTVVGQSSLTTTLKNSIASGRLAHAYLFCGPRGVGKTTCARIFAKTINCLHPNAAGEACNECESCRAFNEGRSYNIHELDAASNNGVEDIKQLMEQVMVPPQVGKYKVFIIDEVHMLSQAAFNAFLKTLEEPPSYVIFILATTEKHKLLATILSRCQIYDFNRMSVQDIVGHLQNVASQEGVTAEPAALNVIAQKADGGMRDALSIFDQVASFCQGNITYQQTIADLNVLDYDYYFRLVDYFMSNDIPQIIMTFNDILSRGFEGNHFINGLNSHFRNLLISRDVQTVKLMEVSDDVKQRYIDQSQRCNPKWLYAAIRKCTDCDLNFRASQNKRLLVEITLIEVAQIAQDPDAYSGRSPKKVLNKVFINEGSGAATAKQQSVNTPQHNGQPAPSASQTISTQVPAGNITSPTGMSTPNSAMIQPSAGNIRVPVMPRNVGTPSAHINNVAARTPVSISLKGVMANGANVQTAHPTVSVSGANVNSASTDGADAVAPVTDERKAFSVYDLIVSLREYAGTLSRNDKAMAARIDTFEPEMLNDTDFEVIADNQMVEKQFQNYRHDIEQYLRTHLHNVDIKMRVRLREADDRPRILSPRQQFAELCKDEVINKFREMFEFEVE